VSLANQDDILNQIYETGYFTNHGPAAVSLENTLQTVFQSDHAVIVSNETLALVMALAGLDISGHIAMSAFCPAFVRNAVLWAGLEPELIDIGDDSGCMSIQAFEQVCSEHKDIDAVLVCDMWCREQTRPLIEELLAKGVWVIVYQCGQFDSSLLGKKEKLITIVSVGEQSCLPTANCAAILTSSGGLAEIYRNIRSSYGARETIKVKATANGRVSEYQAGQATVFLNNIEAYTLHNLSLFRKYREVDAIPYLVPIQGEENLYKHFEAYPLLIEKSFFEEKETQIKEAILDSAVITGPDFMLSHIDLHKYENVKSLRQRLLVLPVGASTSLDYASGLIEELKCIFQ